MLGRRLERRIRGLDLRLRMLEVLLGDRPGIGQPGAPREILLRAPELRLPQRDVGAQRIDIREDLRHAANRLREAGFGLSERRLGIRRIEIYDRLPGAHERRVVGVDADDNARDLRRELHEIAVHIRVVGRFVPAPVEPPPEAGDESPENEHGGQGSEHAIAPVTRLRRGSMRRWRRSVWSRWR